MATAYEQDALDVFDANAIDYGLKPIDDERIGQISTHLLFYKTQRHTNLYLIPAKR